MLADVEALRRAERVAAPGALVDVAAEKIRGLRPLHPGAQRVRETGQAFRFNPMSSRERRIIHLQLNGAPGVRTVSEGSGDRRQLVIYPASTKK